MEVKYPNLLAEMARRGEGQKALAKLLGMSLSSISRRLRGEVDWNIGEIKTICKHFGMDYNQLFE